MRTFVGSIAKCIFAEFNGSLCLFLITSYVSILLQLVRSSPHSAVDTVFDRARLPGGRVSNDMRSALSLDILGFYRNQAQQRHIQLVVYIRSAVTHTA